MRAEGRQPNTNSARKIPSQEKEEERGKNFVACRKKEGKRESSHIAPIQKRKKKEKKAHITILTSQEGASNVSSSPRNPVRTRGEKEGNLEKKRPTEFVKN